MDKSIKRINYMEILEKLGSIEFTVPSFGLETFVPCYLHLCKDPGSKEWMEQYKVIKAKGFSLRVL